MQMVYKFSRNFLFLFCLFLKKSKFAMHVVIIILTNILTTPE